MKQYQTTLEFTTGAGRMLDITDQIRNWVGSKEISEGLLTLFISHTSASLTIQENADSDVQRDLEDALSRLAPAGRGLYRHSAEGEDDMPAHIKCALTNVSLSVPVGGGMPLLGTWQGIFLLEHRLRPHRRQILCHIIGE